MFGFGLKPTERLQTSRGHRRKGPTKAKQDTLRSERRSVLKKSLTEPTLLEMSDYPTNQDLGRCNFSEADFWPETVSGSAVTRIGASCVAGEARAKVVFAASEKGSHDSVYDSVGRAMSPFLP